METSSLVTLMITLSIVNVIVCAWGYNTMENKLLQNILRKVTGLLFFSIILVGAVLIYK